MLVRTADRLIHRPSYNSNFSTLSPVPTEPMQRLTITSCASCSLVSSSCLADFTRVSLYSEVNNMGLICHVDLFPVPGDSDDSADSKRRQDQAQSSPSRASTSTLSPTPYSPNTEGSKQTESLAGTTFVQAANLDYKGNKVLMFVFAVRIFPSLPSPLVPFLCILCVTRDADTPTFCDRISR